MTAETRDTWHPGELAVQSRAGVTEKMAGLGPRLIRDFMPDPHRDFFTRLPMIIVGGEDGAGHLWAAPLFGEPGFIRFDKQQRLLIPDYAGNNFFNTLGNLAVDSRAGLLFLDFAEGHVISLTATAEILWKIDEPVLCGDNGRGIRLTLDAGYVIRNALPHLWKLINDAP